MFKLTRLLLSLLLLFLAPLTSFAGVAQDEEKLPKLTFLGGIAVSANQINLSWVYSSDSRAGFEVIRERGGRKDTFELGVGVDRFVDRELTPNTEYIYHVKAYKYDDKNKKVYLACSSTTIWTPVVVPSLPLRLEVELIALTTDTRGIEMGANLTWTDNAENKLGFKIEKKINQGGFVQIRTMGQHSTSFLDRGLVNGSTYTYRVQSYNNAGGSLYSNEVTVSVEGPIPPDRLVLTPISSTRIDLSWRDNSNNEAGFKIERRIEDRGYVQIATVGANVTSYSCVGLAKDTWYSFRVSAYNDVGDSPFCEGTATTSKIPEPPSNLVAKTVSPSRIDLLWRDNSNNETGFKIEYKTRNGTVWQAATVPKANVTSFSFTGLSENTEYIFRVKAYNDLNSSPYSEEARGITGAPSGEPGEPVYYYEDWDYFTWLSPYLEASPSSPTRIILNWSYRYYDDGDFRLERRRETGNFVHIDTVSARTTTYVDDDVSPGTRYTYRIRAYNYYGNSSYSNEAVATTPRQAKTRIKLSVGKTTYHVNDRECTMDTSPIILEDRVFLPIRFVAEALGAEVNWYKEESRATVVFNGKRIELWLGSEFALVNGVFTYIDPNNPQVFPIIVPPGRTMIPIRFISENLGCEVDWEKQTQEISITYQAS